MFTDIVFFWFWCHLGPQLGPQIAPRSLQEPSKIHPRSHLIFDLFLDPLLERFGANLAPTWPPSPPKMGPSWVQTRSKLGCWFESCFWSELGTICFLILVPTWPQLGPQLGPKIDLKSIQEPSKIHPNLHLVFNWFLDRFLIDFWSMFDPKIDQKSIKNQSKHHPNNTTTTWCQC